MGSRHLAKSANWVECGSALGNRFSDWQFRRPLKYSSAGAPVVRAGQVVAQGCAFYLPYRILSGRGVAIKFGFGQNWAETCRRIVAKVGNNCTSIVTDSTGCCASSTDIGRQRLGVDNSWADFDRVWDELDISAGAGPISTCLGRQNHER